jgi:LPS-assembly protein
MESIFLSLQLPEEPIEVKHCIPSSPILVLFFLLVAGFFHVPAAISAVTADAEQWEITADKITRYEDPPSLIAEGNVILEKKEIVTRTHTATPPDGAIFLARTLKKSLKRKRPRQRRIQQPLS